jgi:PleD family two-component response regulator
MKGHILIIEDDADIAELLRYYLTSQGYDVDLAMRGHEVFQKIGLQVPDLIILDIMLPDLDGYSICTTLRTQASTSHIPIIFLTQKDQRHDLIAGLEMGADDYIIKPFDIEELGLRVQNAIQRVRRHKAVDPLTGFPNLEATTEVLEQALRRRGWALLDCKIDHFDDYLSARGPSAGDRILRSTVRMINQTLHEFSRKHDFVGYAGMGDFLIMTSPALASSLAARLKELFRSEQRHMISAPEADPPVHLPALSLAISIVECDGCRYRSSRELLEVAAAGRIPDTS